MNFNFRRSLLCLVLAATSTLALANQASTHLQPGLWRFHYHSTVQMDGRTIPSMNQSAQQCITDTDPAKLPLMPKLPPNIHCTAPTLQTSTKGYHVTMSCTASEPNGMVSQLGEDFMIAPSDDGNQISFDGTVHQRITGSAMPIPAALVKISATGHHVGLCPASAH